MFTLVGDELACRRWKRLKYIRYNVTNRKHRHQTVPLLSPVCLPAPPTSPTSCLTMTLLLYLHLQVLTRFTSSHGSETPRELSSRQEPWGGGREELSGSFRARRGVDLQPRVKLSWFVGHFTFTIVSLLHATEGMLQGGNLIFDPAPRAAVSSPPHLLLFLFIFYPPTKFPAQNCTSAH